MINKKDKLVMTRYKKQGPWGMSMNVDLYDCDPKTIRDANKIKEFVDTLCTMIKVKRFGETTIVNFGEDERVAGFSMTQLIETSLVSGHFANQTNNVYLDIFSCKEYPPNLAAEYCKKFFGAKKMITKLTFRK